MGYSTDFSGVLKFKKPLTAEQELKLNSFFGEDCRDHPEWGRADLTWIDLELTKDKDGIQWDGSEKTYNLVEKVNLIIEQMQKEFPDFELEGSLDAQGESMEDRWILSIKDGKAVGIETKTFPIDMVCPHCGEPIL